MVPIAKATLVTLLLGCGATGTFALANGGFGIGTATENSNEQGSDVAPASPEVANTARGNTQEIVPGPVVEDAGAREGTAVTVKTLDQPQSQSQSDIPNSDPVNGDGSTEETALTREQRSMGTSSPSSPGNPDTNEKTAKSDGHQELEVTGGGGENTVIQQPANAEQEDTGRERSQPESDKQKSAEGAESSSSLQGKESIPPEQSPQVTGKEDGGNRNPQPALNTVSEPETKTDQTVTSSSKPEEGAKNTETRSVSDTAISSDVQA